MQCLRQSATILGSRWFVLGSTADQIRKSTILAEDVRTRCSTRGGPVPKCETRLSQALVALLLWRQPEGTGGVDGALDRTIGQS